MSSLLSFLCEHLLNIVAKELENNEPEIVAAVENEVKLLTLKLQQLLEKK